MRCEIAASLLHNPKILFLDEPTIGLDAVSKIAVRQFIKEINQKRGTTVILTTHDMQDIEALTNRIILIGKGRKLYDGTLTDIRKKYSPTFVMSAQYEFTNNKINIPNVEVVEQNNQRAVLKFNSNIIKVQDVITYLAKSVNILDIQIESSPIEEVIAKMYRDMKIE
jgi:ABC-2 type transport system ATP-binding protein